MRHQPAAGTAALPVDQAAASIFIADSHRLALDHLGRVFADGRPLAILIGEGKSASSYIIRNFLAGMDGDVVVVRFAEPCSDATAVMRNIIRAIGFEPKEMSPADLENIFTLFLSHQRTHRRRTIICIDDTQDCGWWVLDKMRRLVELETDGKFGLMVLLSGQPGLNQLLNEAPLNSISSEAGPRILLAPFTLAETTEYIRRRVESAGTEEIGQKFEFHAISLVHELSGGIPDSVSALCSKCLEMLEEEDLAAVTTELVGKADKRLSLGSMAAHSEAEEESVPVNGAGAAHGQLVARINGVVVQEQALTRGHILIGRDELCDIRLPSRPVSRHHALVVDSSIGVRLLDLGSRNGTIVNGRRIKQYALRDNDVIVIGDCKIEYNAGDKQEISTGDIEPTDSFEPNGAGLASCAADYGRKIQLVQPAGLGISPAQHRAHR